LVVLDTPVRPAADGWAAGMLEALEPTVVWGAVPATRKTEDVVAWLDAVGGVDALALTEVTDTVSPAALLATGIAVARLDGDPATPDRWLALAAEALAA